MGDGGQQSPWYAEGLEFSCSGCGDCCRGEGYVWVSPEEIEALTDFLGIEIAEMSKRYLRSFGPETSLTEKANYDCIFWEGHCTVYAARPGQCRTFPFWPNNIASKGAWKKLERQCRGAGQGEHYDLVEIRNLSQGRGKTENGPSEGGCCGSV